MGDHIPALLFDKDSGNASVTTDVEAFLGKDLSVSRLNIVHKYLWLAGRPTCSRSLHHQEVLGRNIVPTERADLHLLWSPKAIFIKPLPAYIISLPTLHRNPLALSFLVSYLWLIRHPLDFILAQEKHLLPTVLTWEDWIQLCKANHQYLNDWDNLEPRYQYGELRLGRINMIYRIACGHWMRGYNFGYNRYSDMMTAHFAWFAVVFAFLNIVLGALQVGLSTERLQNEKKFQRASFVFSVFALVVPLTVAAALIVMSIFLFVENFAWAFRNDRQVKKSRGLNWKPKPTPKPTVASQPLGTPNGP